MSRAEELARMISAQQLDTHTIIEEREYLCDPLGFWHQLTPIGREAVRIARALPTPQGYR